MNTVNITAFLKFLFDVAIEQPFGMPVPHFWMPGSRRRPLTQFPTNAFLRRRQVITEVTRAFTNQLGDLTEYLDALPCLKQSGI